VAWGAVMQRRCPSIVSSPLKIRQVQSKAILKLAGIADDLDLHKRIPGPLLACPAVYGVNEFLGGARLGVVGQVPDFAGRVRVFTQDGAGTRTWRP
jgi:hypothetical protein